MTDEELNQHLALQVARLLGDTHVEGWYSSVSCSTAGDYPSMGISQWEGGRGNELLSMIPGGNHYAYRTYSDIANSGELDALSNLLDSEAGRQAQQELLSRDTYNYITTLRPYFTDSKCLIMAAAWCPTSTYVVEIFVKNRYNWGYNINNLEVLRDLFAEQYYKAADVGEMYRQGYYNRAINTYNWLINNEIW